LSRRRRGTDVVDRALEQLEGLMGVPGEQHDWSGVLGQGVLEQVGVTQDEPLVLTAGAQGVVLQHQDRGRVVGVKGIESGRCRARDALRPADPVGLAGDDAPAAQSGRRGAEDRGHGRREVVVAGDGHHRDCGVCRGEPVAHGLGPHDRAVVADVSREDDRVERAVLLGRREHRVQARGRVDLGVVGHCARSMQVGVGEVEQPHGTDGTGRR
jgi:hypothetical protein